MRAAVLREYNADLSIEEAPDPGCDPDGVVLKVLACGICRSDWHGWTGEHPRVKPGQIPGHEYCGEVVEAGPQAKWRVGDRLVAPFILACGSCPDCQSGESHTCKSQRLPGFIEPGAFAEYVHVPFAHNLARLPDSMSPVVAAGLGCRVTTAWHALTGRAGLRAGEWLAVHGTGGIGLSCLILGQCARGSRDRGRGCGAGKARPCAFARRRSRDRRAGRRRGGPHYRTDRRQGRACFSVEALGIEATTNAKAGSFDGASPQRPTLAPAACARRDHRPIIQLHRRVALVEQPRQLARVAVDAERELRQVVRADREAVEARGEFLGEDHVRGDLAHHVDLQAVLAALEPVLAPSPRARGRPLRRAAERDHHDDVVEAHLLAQLADRAAFQREAVAVALE
jgi:hypothetical protein